MEQVLINESSLQDIANAIREKTEGTELIFPSEMGDVIRAIETGGTLKSASGTVSPSAGKTFSVNGLGFKPLVAFYHSPTDYKVHGFAGPGVSKSCYSRYKNSSFTASDAGFTFTATATIINSATYNWYAFGF